MTEFVPWIRAGLAGAVTSVDPLEGPLPSRAAFTVHAAVGGGAGSLDVRLAGPGDVLAPGRGGTMIRTDPADGADTAEPTFFCCVEFAIPDLPWMFTPAAPNGDRLRPWIVLIVVAADICELDPGDERRLPVLLVPDVQAELPDLGQSHAWAHAQGGRSRLLCPRVLADGTSYIAAVVPAFESGRLAGLRRPVPDTATTDPAWEVSHAEPRELPVYASWRFTTGPGGDFATLASRLRRHPLRPETAVGRTAEVPELGPWVFPGALGSTDDPLPPPEHAAALTALVDGPFGPPCYGRWHAAEGSLAGAAKPWLRRLNLDPRYRAAAALGARLVQEGQEELMADAWRQIGEVEAANALLRQAQLARAASQVPYARLAELEAAELVLMCGPLLTRVRGERLTLAAEIESSRVPRGLLSPAFRRALRPRGPLARRTGLTAAELLRQVDDGLPAVGERPVPDGTVTLPGWCEITGDLLDEHREQRPAHVSESAWDALLRAAVEQQRGMPPCAPAEPPPGRPAIPLARIKKVLLAATRPDDTIPARVAVRLTPPEGWAPADPLAPILAAPVLDRPLSRDLIALSPGLLLPGIEELPPESVTALPVNERFVESLMVGANHEFVRELLWRGYPTDQRGTSLRRFWDRPVDDDIPAIDHTWDGDLGEHLFGAGEQIVLVIRGELLRRYPRTRVYAAPVRLVDGRREPVPGEERLPVFAGRIPPDLTFLGFDLPADPLGWFFVLQQPSGESRFGPPATMSGRTASGHVDLGAERGQSAAQVAARCERRPLRVCLHSSDLLEVSR
ncbi:hypothetical protein ABT061_43410 [Streptosporangium sp. NPDC002544]|uniref:hypothetical protein n=1 Tax=Streptosporangium sp. NPDC002544 TaxID=3154538 RepID=UPI003317515D